MKIKARMLLIAMIGTLGSIEAFSQDDEARVQSGLPSEIGRKACTNQVGNADGMLSGTLEVQGLPANEKSPTFTVTLLANGAVFARDRIKDGGSFGFSCVPRTGLSLVVEADNVEVASTPISSLSPPPISNRRDIVITWNQLGRAFKKNTNVVDLRSSYTRTVENQQIFDKAVASLREKKPDNSVKLFNQIIAQDPNDFVAWTELGNLYFTAGNTTEAEKAYAKALQLKVDFSPALMNAGKLYISMKKPDPAIEMLTRAFNANPSSADACQYLGEAYLLAKKGSKAVIYLNKAIELEPVEKAEIHIRLAALYNAVGAKLLAAAEYKLLLKKIPNHAEKETMQKYIAENAPNN